MAAGLGFKTFTTGEVLTAADTNGYLMQGVLVFASAAARDAAITSPQEGQCCYLKDTDAVLTYSGAAWVGFDDSNAIQNTIVDAKGDIVAASGSDTPARLAVGANNTVLTADSAEATGLKWVTPINYKVLQVVGATTTTVASNSTSTFADTNLTATITPSSATSKVLVLVSQNTRKSNGNASNGVNLRLVRTSTTICTFAIYNSYTFSALELIGSASVSFLDTPATTSATTYKTQFMNPNNTAAVSVQFNSETSSMILLEIGA